jgi:hypothetical protein
MANLLLDRNPEKESLNKICETRIRERAINAFAYDSAVRALDIFIRV